MKKYFFLKALAACTMLVAINISFGESLTCSQYEKEVKTIREQCASIQKNSNNWQVNQLNLAIRICEARIQQLPNPCPDGETIY